MGRQKGRAGKQMGTGEKSEMHGRKEINFLQRKVYWEKFLGNHLPSEERKETIKGCRRRKKRHWSGMEKGKPHKILIDFTYFLLHIILFSLIINLCVLKRKIGQAAKRSESLIQKGQHGPFFSGKQKW